MRTSLAGGAFLLGLVLTTLPAGAARKDDDELRQELQALKQGLEEVKQQLAEITRLLQQQREQQQQARQQVRQQPPRGPQVENVVFELGANDVKGGRDAKLTLVEFTDYECPFCARYVRDTLPQIDKEYVQSGKLRYVLLDLPLESIHKRAFKASQATHCAKDQGKYWEMHDRLFANQKALEPWSAHAEALGLDAAAFEACLSSGKHDPLIRANMNQAQKVGITATPGFVLARSDPQNPTKVTGLTFIRGAQTFEAFKNEIEQALAASN